MPLSVLCCRLCIINLVTTTSCETNNNAVSSVVVVVSTIIISPAAATTQPVSVIQKGNNVYALAVQIKTGAFIHVT